MRFKKFILISVFLVGSFVFANAEKPKLILQITVDQLRGDLPQKYMKHMGSGGFRYLEKKGIWYRAAFYEHSVTQTAVGHTTLATGAYPSAHGIIANSWFDRKSGKSVYNVQDNSTHILSFNSNKETQLSNNGRSPKNIISSTFSDELALFSNKKSKIFAVSVKDRGSITLAGHSGKAFWFSKKSGEFVTSSYYYDSYPSWVVEYNKHKRNNDFENKAWQMSLRSAQYMYEDNQIGEIDYAGFGTTFPHKYGSKDDKYFNYRIASSPAGDELTLDFAKVIISSQNLGKNGVTDFLAISFSSTDYVGHLFGPSSVEAEENLLRLDKTLANLFKFIDKKIGLDNTLIVLSADHGVPETPAHNHTIGLESENIYIKYLKDEQVLLEELGIDKALIKAFVTPYLYLDYEVIAKRKLNIKDVAKDMAKKLESMKGISSAIISKNLEKNSVSETLLNLSASKNFHSTRSGDILVVNKVHYTINSYKKSVACNHGSPYRYDTFVPIIFAGFGIKHKSIYTEVSPNQIAPTLSAIVGTRYPSDAVKPPFVDVLNAVEYK